MSSAERIITSAEMRILDRNSEYLGVSTLQLMENAGRAVADEVGSRFGRGSEVLIFGGVGRNGGDGMVAARHLAGRGFRVSFALIGDESEIRDESVKRNWQALRQMSSTVATEVLADSSLITQRKCDIVIDALLGTGAKGVLRQPVLKAVDSFNHLRGFKIAVDVPTGVDSDTGEILGNAVRADLTVTLHAKKTGLEKAKECCGEVKVADIGIPPEAELFAGPGNVEAVRRPRPPEAHKGDFGRLLVIGGSETYTGAPALVALAALRTGVDLAFVAAPEKTALAIASFSPNLITVRLRGERLTQAGLAALRDHLARCTAVVVGPGLGTSGETFIAVRRLIRMMGEARKPALMDADAVKAMGRVKRKVDFPVVVTPHAGEFEALSGKKPSRDLGARMEEVKDLAVKLGGVVLLKGHIDMISDGSRVRLNRTGNPAMTVGGTGDVLSGIVGALLAQGIRGFDAAVAGAFINGAAGDFAFKEYGYHLAPTDLIHLIPNVMNDPMSHRNVRQG